MEWKATPDSSPRNNIAEVLEHGHKDYGNHTYCTLEHP